MTLNAQKRPTIPCWAGWGVGAVSVGWWEHNVYPDGLSTVESDLHRLIHKWVWITGVGTKEVHVLIYQAARQEANKLLTKHWDGELPIRLGPFTDALGASKYETDLTGGVSGMVSKVSSGQPIIVLNSSDTHARRRFTWAHELGHIIERRDVAKDDDYSFSEFRGRTYDLHEFFADEFAGALLMPTDELDRAQREGLTKGQMAQRFGVSVQAVDKRLSRLAEKPE